MAKKASEPPGSFGFLGLGAEEGVAFLRSPLRFAEERQRRHGARLFKSKLLRKPCAFLLGFAELREMLEDSSGSFSRAGSLFSLVEGLYGRGVMLLDGEEGARVRGLLHQQMSADLLGSRYLSMMDELFSDSLLLWEALYRIPDEARGLRGERAVDWMMEYLHTHRGDMPHTSRRREEDGSPARPLPGLTLLARGLVEDYKEEEGGSISFYENCKAFCNIANLLMWFGDADMDDRRLARLTNALKEHYRAAMSVPVASLGGGFKRGLLAKEFLLTFIRKRIERCRRRTSEEDAGGEGALDDCLLARVVASRLPDGQTWANDEELETQVLWMVSNVIPKTVASLVTSLVMATHGGPVWREMTSEQDSLAASDEEEALSTGERLGRMPVLTAALEETLRLHPPFVTFCKAANKELPDFFGFRIPKDWQCFYLSGIANRDASVYDNAEMFDHSRWLGQEKERETNAEEKVRATESSDNGFGVESNQQAKTENEEKLDSEENEKKSESQCKRERKKEMETERGNDFERERERGRGCPMHLSFGYGSRECLGRGWARLVTKLMAAHLLQEFSFSFVRGQDLSYKCLPVLRPRSGLRIHGLSRRTP